METSSIDTESQWKIKILTKTLPFQKTLIVASQVRKEMKNNRIRTDFNNKLDKFNCK